MHKVRVGDAEVIQLGEGTRPIPGSAAYPEAGEQLAQRFPDMLDADGAITVSHACFAVVADGQAILVDTGLGPSRGGAMLDELGAAGIAPADVAIVVNTHVHGDHTGGNVDESADPPAPRFRDARYYFPRLDWDHYRAQAEPPPTLARDLEPIAAHDQLELYEGECAISPSLTLIPTPGHTPGHSSVRVESAGERAYVVGDALVTLLELEEPFWRNMFDWDSQRAGETRLELFDRLIREGALAAIVHYPPPGLGRFAEVAGKRVWRPI
jgi:glyoxylase-like metal-dependent hydrolase (beta-lactamase superfamily II)